MRLRNVSVVLDPQFWPTFNRRQSSDSTPELDIPQTAGDAAEFQEIAEMADHHEILRGVDSVHTSLDETHLVIATVPCIADIQRVWERGWNTPLRRDGKLH